MGFEEKDRHDLFGCVFDATPEQYNAIRLEFDQLPDSVRNCTLQQLVGAFVIDGPGSSFDMLLQLIEERCAVAARLDLAIRAIVAKHLGGGEHGERW